MISKKSYCSNNTGKIQGNRVKHSVKQGHADSSKTFKTRMWVRLPRREWSVQGSTVLLIWFSYLFGCFLAPEAQGNLCQNTVEKQVKSKRLQWLYTQSNTLFETNNSFGKSFNKHTNIAFNNQNQNQIKTNNKTASPGKWEESTFNSYIILFKRPV